MSTDGDTIVAYAQWTSDDAHRAFSQSRTTPGRVVIPTFDVDGPERQRHIIGVVAGPTGREPDAVPGVIAAHLHASTDDGQAQWRNEITGTAGIRFTGYKRFHLHPTLTNA